MVAGAVIFAIVYVFGRGLTIHATDVELTRVPVSIERQGTVGVRVTFNKIAWPNDHQFSLQLVENDGPGSLADDVIATRSSATLAKGSYIANLDITLRCPPPNRYLNGDTDDSDKVYEVFPLVVDDGNGSSKTGSEVSIACGQPAD